MEKISIIIPVYNSEKYIKKCIDSILEQTYKSYEIIVINDGSTDSSLKVINSLFNKNKKVIKVIDQKNIGIAKTRNKGISLATGKYIMFIDNDDWIDNDYLENYISMIEEENADIVIGGYRRRTEEKILFSNQPKSFIAIYSLLAPWAKIYKLDFLKKNNIEFLDYELGEDVYFNTVAYSKTDKIVLTDYTGYNWFYNDKSVSNTIQKKIIKPYPLLDSIYNSTKINDELEFFYLRYCIWFVLFTAKKSTYRELIINYEEIFNWLKEHVDKFSKNKYLRYKNNKDFKNTLIIKMFLFLRIIKCDKIFLKLYKTI